MDEKFDDLSVALDDVIDLLEPQDSVRYARTIGALTVAVDRITKAATDEERRAAWAKWETPLTRLWMTTRAVPEVPPSDRKGKLDVLEAEIEELAIVDALDALPLESRAGEAARPSADRAVERAIKEIADEFGRQSDDLAKEIRKFRKIQTEQKNATTEFAVRADKVILDVTGFAKEAVDARLTEVTATAIKTFRTSSERESRREHWWIAATLALGLGGVGLALFLTLRHPPTSVNMESAHVLAAVPLAWMAGFAYRRSSQHSVMSYKYEHTYQNIQLLMSEPRIDFEKLQDVLLYVGTIPWEDLPPRLRSTAGPLPTSWRAILGARRTGPRYDVPVQSARPAPPASPVAKPDSAARDA